MVQSALLDPLLNQGEVFTLNLASFSLCSKPSCDETDCVERVVHRQVIRRGQRSVVVATFAVFVDSLLASPVVLPTGVVRPAHLLAKHVRSFLSKRFRVETEGGGQSSNPAWLNVKAVE